VTNGIHILSWLAKDMRDLLGRYLGERWVEAPDNRDLWKRVKRIPDPELWHVRESLRRQLVVYARRRLRESMEKRGMSKSELAVADEVLDPSALTIGFARRFATYKRGNLLFRDIPRLKKILMDVDRPVQFIFAGKAHPRDDGGKNIIKDIVHTIRDADFRHKIVFLEDYDISLARKLVAGVDLWLNNPRRPLEACGTSGMKVTPNAGLNMSILDGWWEEGYNSEVGWAIGVPEIYDDPEYQDEVESNAIYTLLEKEILPTFYDRSADGIPRRWIQFVKEAMTQLLPVFNTNHMVENYTNHFYLNASINWNQCEYDNFAHARAVAAWHQRVLQHWHEVCVTDVKVEHTHDTLGVGESAKITAEISLGTLAPTDIIVEVYYGKVEYSGNIIHGKSEWLSNVESLGDGRYRFTGTLACDRSGRFGCTVRVLNNSPLDIRRLDVAPLIWW
uniref:alpha-glucan family phosphorylase n=1 Tax=Chrysiogenes arsenatis TaxID=309797 RepID=UPI00055720ED